MSRPPPAPGPTPSDSTAHAELATLALDLAVNGAARVRAEGSDRLAVQTKSTATDLVTRVDRETERWLIAQLRRHRPGDAVLGEEGGAHPAGPQPAAGGRVRWLLDPIDGTVNFVLGLPQYAVSVAAEVDGVVVAGAVSNPATGETFHARLGGGAYLRDAAGTVTPLSARRTVPLERAVVATGFGYDAALRTRQIEVVGRLLPRIADLRRLGAAALDLCFLAAGRVDGYFEAGLNPWDYAAGALIAAEAGCVVTDLRGNAPSPRFVAGAGPDLAAAFFAILEALDADGVLPPAS